MFVVSVIWHDSDGVEHIHPEVSYESLETALFIGETHFKDVSWEVVPVWHKNGMVCVGNRCMKYKRDKRFYSAMLKTMVKGYFETADDAVVAWCENWDGCGMIREMKNYGLGCDKHIPGYGANVLEHIWDNGKMVK